MGTYIILSRVSPDALRGPQSLRKLADEVSAKVRSECPGVTWKASYGTLGRFDVVDIVESDDLKQIQKVSKVLRTYGHEVTETLVATPWKEFISSL
jgi:uncharacterized protein with GYD domain